jgi:glutathione S-transferase
MLLYDSAISGNCYKVRLLLAHLQVPYERRELSVTDRSNRPEVIGGLNPALRVPTLVLDDGRPLAESNAILTYFAEGTPYLPSDQYERALVMQWLFFEQYELEPNIAVARFLQQYVEGDPDPVRLEGLRAGGTRTLEAIEQHLSATPFLVAGRYTIADIAIYGYTHVAEDGGFDLSQYPAVQRWIARVAGQPGHVTIDA